jgi:hypothetical protein
MLSLTHMVLTIGRKAQVCFVRRLVGARWEIRLRNNPIHTLIGTLFLEHMRTHQQMQGGAYFPKMLKCNFDCTQIIVSNLAF